MSDSVTDKKTARLAGRRLAFLVTDGFEQVELTGPRDGFTREGATCVIVSPKPRAQGFNHHDKGESFAADVTLDQAREADFDALVLPGGVSNPDALRTMPAAVAFVKAFAQRGKPIAAICHGPWTLIEADAVRGRTMTSWPSLKTDLTNAGATWVDREVVTDHGLVTSRKPDDIPAFVAQCIEAFTEPQHAKK